MRTSTEYDPDQPAGILHAEGDVKLVWQCQQAMCVLSSRNKIILLWVLITGIQDNATADASARKGLNSPFFSLKPAISVSPYGDRFKAEWLKERRSKHWAPAQGKMVEALH
jgi:hypothetical protein